MLFIVLLIKLLITLCELLLQLLNMLVEMRKYSPESQSVILGTVCASSSSSSPFPFPPDSRLKEDIHVYLPVILLQLHRELAEANFDINALILSPEQIQEIVQK